jgi:hypothetical protein
VQTALSHLVLVAMLLHSMLGCCIHHHHGDVRDALGTLTEVMDAGRHACGDDERVSPVPQDDSRDKSCPREICVFLRHLEGDSSLQMRGWVALCVCPPIPHEEASSPSVDTAAPTPPDFPNHVRPHLAKQVFLI